MSKHKPYKQPPRKRYGPYDLDEQGVEVLQKFCVAIYREYCDGVKLPRNVDGLAFSDFRSKLYYKFYRDFTEGRVDYDFEITDAEWVKRAPDLSRLTNKYSKEV